MCMPWVDGKFFYTKAIIKAIAENYGTIYDGLPVSWRADTYNLWSLAEYRADFCNALNAIGRGRWHGELHKPFNYYRKFGRLQRVIIAGLIGVDDETLDRAGFYGIPQLRGYAYYLMCKVLNEKDGVK